ncbi:MAG: hypothetical protein R3E88_08825 [Myxococcota bacterium]
MSTAPATTTLSGVIRPGGSDALGEIAITGDLLIAVNSRVESEIFGASPPAVDRITATGIAEILKGAIFDLSFEPGATVARGDAYELLQADGGIVVDGPLANVLRSFTPSANRFFVPTIEPSAGTATGAERLVVRVKDRIAANWKGGAGAWEDASLWLFGGVAGPGSSGSPSEDDSTLFAASIDTTAYVALGSRAAVDSLFVGMGSELAIGAGGDLDLRGAGRPGGRELTNDGVVRLEGGGSIVGDGTLALLGSGTLALSNDGSSRIGSGDDLAITNASGHTIQGSGFLDVGTLSLNNFGTIRASVGAPLVLRGAVTNRGLLAVDQAAVLIADDITSTSSGFVSVEAGGTLDTRSLAVERFGRFVATGADTLARAYLLFADGDVEIADSAVLTVAGLSPAGDGTITLSNGGVLDLTYGVTRARNAIALDGGRVVAGGFLWLEGTKPTTIISGSGVLDFTPSMLPSPAGVVLSRTAAISPGNAPGELGRIDVLGTLSLRDKSTAKFDIAVAGADHIAATGNVTLSAGATIAAHVAPDLVAARGQVFDLIDAPHISSALPLVLAIEAPSTPDGSLFLMPELLSTSAGEVLSLIAKAPVTASWTGGAGNFVDADHWRFDAPGGATQGSIPTEDGATLYHVVIEGGDGDDARVALDRDAAVESLYVGANDVFSVSGASLDVRGAGFGVRSARPGSGVVHNDGTIVLGDAFSPGAVHTEGDIVLAGTGALVASSVGGNEISSLTGAIVNGASHTLRGALRIDPGRTGTEFSTTVGTFRNDGVVVADAAPGIAVVQGAVDNFGTMRADGAGHLLLGSSFTNSGRLEARDGGSISFGGFGPNRGTILASGQGSRIANSSFVRNEGTIEIVDGATWTGSISQYGTQEASIHVGAGGLWAGSFLDVIGGAFRLDGGAIDGRRLWLDGADAELAGTAMLTDELLVYGGSLSIGPVGGVGVLTIEGDLSVAYSGRIVLELGGTVPGVESDLLTVLGVATLSSADVTVDFISNEGESDPFAPALGDEFDLIVASTFVGFDPMTAHLPELPADLAWLAQVVDRGADSIFRLRIVPEPGTSMLVAIGLASLAAHSRCRRPKGA